MPTDSKSQIELFKQYIVQSRIFNLDPYRQYIKQMQRDIVQQIGGNLNYSAQNGADVLTKHCGQNAKCTEQKEYTQYQLADKKWTKHKILTSQLNLQQGYFKQLYDTNPYLAAFYLTSVLNISMIEFAQQYNKNDETQPSSAKQYHPSTLNMSQINNETNDAKKCLNQEQQKVIDEITEIILTSSLQKIVQFARPSQNEHAKQQYQKIVTSQSEIAEGSNSVMLSIIRINGNTITSTQNNLDIGDVSPVITSKDIDQKEQKSNEQKTTYNENKVFTIINPPFKAKYANAMKHFKTYLCKFFPHLVSKSENILLEKYIESFISQNIEQIKIKPILLVLNTLGKFKESSLKWVYLFYISQLLTGEIQKHSVDHLQSEILMQDKEIAKQTMNKLNDQQDVQLSATNLYTPINNVSDAQFGTLFQQFEDKENDKAFDEIQLIKQKNSFQFTDLEYIQPEQIKYMQYLQGQTNFQKKFDYYDKLLTSYVKLSKFEVIKLKMLFSESITAFLFNLREILFTYYNVSYYVFEKLVVRLKTEQFLDIINGFDQYTIVKSKIQDEDSLNWSVNVSRTIAKPRQFLNSKNTAYVSQTLQLNNHIMNLIKTELYIQSITNEQHDLIDQVQNYVKKYYLGSMQFIASNYSIGERYQLYTDLIKANFESFSLKLEEQIKSNPNLQIEVQDLSNIVNTLQILRYSSVFYQEVAFVYFVSKLSYFKAFEAANAENIGETSIKIIKNEQLLDILTSWQKAKTDSRYTQFMQMINENSNICVLNLKFDQQTLQTLLRRCFQEIKKEYKLSFHVLLKILQVNQIGQFVSRMEKAVEKHSQNDVLQSNRKVSFQQQLRSYKANLLFNQTELIALNDSNDYHHVNVLIFAIQVLNLLKRLRLKSQSLNCNIQRILITNAIYKQDYQIASMLLNTFTVFKQQSSVISSLFENYQKLNAMHRSNKRLSDKQLMRFIVTQNILEQYVKQVEFNDQFVINSAVQQKLTEINDKNNTEKTDQNQIVIVSQQTAHQIEDDYFKSQSTEQQLNSKSILAMSLQNNKLLGNMKQLLENCKNSCHFNYYDPNYSHLQNMCINFVKSNFKLVEANLEQQNLNAKTETFQSTKQELLDHELLSILLTQQSKQKLGCSDIESFITILQLYNSKIDIYLAQENDLTKQEPNIVEQFQQQQTATVDTDTVIDANKESIQEADVQNTAIAETQQSQVEQNVSAQNDTLNPRPIEEKQQIEEKLLLNEQNCLTILRENIDKLKSSLNLIQLIQYNSIKLILNENLSVKELLSEYSTFLESQSIVKEYENAEKPAEEKQPIEEHEAPEEQEQELEDQPIRPEKTQEVKQNDVQQQKMENTAKLLSKNTYFSLKQVCKNFKYSQYFTLLADWNEFGEIDIQETSKHSKPKQKKSLNLLKQISYQNAKLKQNIQATKNKTQQDKQSKYQKVKKIINPGKSVKEPKDYSNSLFQSLKPIDISIVQDQKEKDTMLINHTILDKDQQTREQKKLTVLELEHPSDEQSTVQQQDSIPQILSLQEQEDKLTQSHQRPNAVLEPLSSFDHASEASPTQLGQQIENMKDKKQKELLLAQQTQQQVKPAEIEDEYSYYDDGQDEEDYEEEHQEEKRKEVGGEEEQWEEEYE